MDKNKIIFLVTKSLQTLYEKDCEIISNHTNERAIVFRFGIYFNNEVEKNKLNYLNYLNYKVDIEYNRNIEEPKRLKSEKIVIPDLILHKRGSNDNNLLVIEFKTFWNSNQEEDTKKIENFCNSKGEYKYRYGISILITEKLEDVFCTFFELDKKGESYKWDALMKLTMKNRL